MEENYVRICNKNSQKFYAPLKSSSPSSQRGVINEVGFRIFAAQLDHSELSNELIDRCKSEGFRHISRLRQLHRKPVQMPDESDVLEARELAVRLGGYFSRGKAVSIMAFPRFPGCGWLEQCQGDVLSDNILSEVKAGARGFRNIDFRQVLTYCALNFAAKCYDIDRVCLLNPRTGGFIVDDVEAVCRNLSGRSAIEVFGDIVEYISSPPGRYTTV